MKQEYKNIMTPVPGAVPDVEYRLYSSGEWSRSLTAVPQEMALTITVDSHELLTILCTPVQLEELVLGFLYSEGIIDKKNDISILRICQEDALAEVTLNKPEFKMPEKRALASGFGRGTTFSKNIPPVESDVSISPSEILSLMKQLEESAVLHRYSGGVHAAALANSTGLLVMSEDIGRHNTLDKIVGYCLITEVSTVDRVLVATGRISSEMLSKAARMRIPIVISRSSPTDRAISLAQEFGITLIAYVREDRFSVYSHEERVNKGYNNSKEQVWRKCDVQ